MATKLLCNIKSEIRKGNKKDRKQRNSTENRITSSLKNTSVNKSKTLKKYVPTLSYAH
jgi:hypothetical protein